MRCGAWPEIARAAAANIVSYRTPCRRSNRFVSNTLSLASMGAEQKQRTGIGKEAIAALMSHADKKTTEIYLQGGVKALRDTDYRPVEAPLTLSDMLR